MKKWLPLPSTGRPARLGRDGSTCGLLERSRHAVSTCAAQVVSEKAKLAAAVPAPTDWATLGMHPSLSYDTNSGFVTQAPKSQHGKAEQPMMLGGRSVLAIALDARQPSLWTGVIGRVQGVLVWSRLL